LFPLDFFDSDDLTFFERMVFDTQWP